MIFLYFGAFFRARSDVCLLTRKEVPILKKSSVRKLAVTGVLAALVFAASWLRVPPGGTAFVIHLGNVMCILSGLLLGGFFGGCAAGIGSFLFDLSNPAYIASAPFTLAFKFLMAYVTGRLAYAGGKSGESLRRNTAAGAAGAAAYIALYLTKRWFYDYRLLEGLSTGPALVKLAANASSSVINAAIAVAVAVPLHRAIKAALNRAGLAF